MRAPVMKSSGDKGLSRQSSWTPACGGQRTRKIDVSARRREKGYALWIEAVRFSGAVKARKVVWSGTRTAQRNVVDACHFGKQKHAGEINRQASSTAR